MIARINDKIETTLRVALRSVARAEEDQITVTLDALDDQERAAVLGLAGAITCYVMVDVSRSTWPLDSSVRGIAEDLATTGTLAKRLQLDAEEIYTYLSRTVVGPERLEEVIPEPKFTRFPIIVAEQALAVYHPKGMGIWDYLSQIESAIEVASALDAAVLPAAVMRAYMPKPDADGPGT